MFISFISAHPESDSAVFDADSTRGSGVFGEDDDHGGSQYWAECDVTGTFILNLTNFHSETLPGDLDLLFSWSCVSRR